MVFLNEKRESTPGSGMFRIGCWLERLISTFLCVQVYILMSVSLPD